MCDVLGKFGAFVHECRDAGECNGEGRRRGREADGGRHGQNLLPLQQSQSHKHDCQKGGGRRFYIASF